MCLMAATHWWEHRMACDAGVAVPERASPRARRETRAGSFELFHALRRFAFPCGSGEYLSARGTRAYRGGGVVFVWHVAVFRAMEAAMEDRLRMLFNAR